MNYVIYGDPGSGAFSTEAALAEVGGAYEFHAVSLEKNEQKSPEFLAINPTGKMPALKLPGGEIVTESAAILLTIAERFPDSALLPPPASFARAQALRWIAFLAAEVYPMVEISDYPERFVPAGEAAEALRERAKVRIRERLLALETAVTGPWLLETGFSAADIYIANFSRWRNSIGADWLKQDHIPKIMALADTVSQRPKIAPVWKRHFPRG
ncbi:MAG: glutathione S-transferase family protein [Pseudomonadota bacterium]|nr:glutathione S-transferase family protein [Pseudomonadota bacterium]